jgi:acyl-CoA synthetase (AMP-forming)/AMP-acid ligase II
VTGRRYRYAEARELCRRFAASLRRAGLQPGSTLVIVMSNTVEWPIILLGAMEAGIIVSTVNPDYKAGKYTSIPTSQRMYCTPSLLDRILNTLPVFIRRWRFKYTYTRLFFRKTAYTKYDVPWLVEGPYQNKPETAQLNGQYRISPSTQLSSTYNLSVRTTFQTSWSPPSRH